MDGSYQWHVEAQNSEGYMDGDASSIFIDMSDFFAPFEELEKKLKSEIEPYKGRITEFILHLSVTR